MSALSVIFYISVLPLSAILGLNFSGRALSRPQVRPPVHVHERAPAGARQRGAGRDGGLANYDGRPRPRSEKDATLAQKLGQLQPFIAVFPQKCVGQLAYFGPT